MIWDNSIWSVLLLPCSRLYGAVMTLRNRLYDAGILTASHAAVPVVSVGNLTVGGTGKTPLVEALVRFLAAEGMRPAVVSRGYGRRGKAVLVVADGAIRCADPDLAGDEPLMLARRLAGTPVVVGTDRVAAAERAAGLGCDVIVLDDGFQHRRLARDLDVVALRASEPFGNGRCLPAGPLREPTAGLGRADALVFTGDEPAAERNWGDKPVLRGRLEPVEWLTLPAGPSRPLEFLRNKSVLAVSGIGHPAAFEKTLADLGLHCVRHLAFRDHHRYSAGDLRRIVEQAEALTAESVVTTEKDAVRFGHRWIGALPLHALSIRMKIEGGDGPMRNALEAVLRMKKETRRSGPV
jgi:tetraacyldisaccharide 4'-kinase